MNYDIFQNINKIIERDSKATTYKFALLRGVIDLIQDNSPFISVSSEKVHFPIGLLIEKWILYYYPILESSNFIPQIYGDANLAFEVQFRKIISGYTLNGGFSAFYNDLRNKGIPKHIQSDFIKLAKKLQDTITRMPMRYIGRSISKDYYSIFQFETLKALPRSENVDIEYLILNFGTFSIPREYYEAFKIFGSFINGKDSILFKWADFSVNASGKMLSVEKVVNEVLKSPITEREVREAKELYKSILKKEGKVYCVWTGKIISQYDVDHMIPFSVWKNNDLWNLLPSNSAINQQKSDKIPSTALIERRKEMIIYYWEILKEHQLNRFQKEIQLGLLGNLPFASYKESAILQLQKNCEYLITNRGYEEWSI
jgi:hypothetical protein